MKTRTTRPVSYHPSQFHFRGFVLLTRLLFLYISIFILLLVFASYIFHFLNLYIYFIGKQIPTYLPRVLERDFLLKSVF